MLQKEAEIHTYVMKKYYCFNLYIHVLESGQKPRLPEPIRILYFIFLLVINHKSEKLLCHDSKFVQESVYIYIWP